MKHLQQALVESGRFTQLGVEGLGIQFDDYIYAGGRGSPEYPLA